MKKILKKVLIVFAGILVIVIFIGLYLTGFTSGEQYLPTDEKIQALKEKQVKVLEGKRYFGDAWMEKRGDLYILHLKGSPYEIGYQHGILLKEEIKKGVVPEYADPIHHGRQKGFSLKTWLIHRYLNFEVFRTLEEYQPKDIREELKGIADGCGISYETVFKANNDTALPMYFMPKLVKGELDKLAEMGIHIGGCSTFVASKRATIDGKTIVGRNTDYHGMEGWPKYQTVMFIEPEMGFRHVKVGTAGLVMWAPGMNEKGIVLCAHYMFYYDMTPEGWSIAAFTDEILRKADSLESAMNILNESPRGASCGFVIIDGKVKDAFAAEVSTGKATIRRMERSTIVMTNMAISEEKQKIDFLVQYRLNEGVPGRQRRLEQLIDIHYGRITSQLAAAFMGDHIRFTTSTERCAFGIVGVTYNVNSMVFSPEDMKLWVAAGPAPVANNPFIGLDFKAEIKGVKSNVKPPVLPGYRFRNTKKRLGMQKYNQAYVIYDRNPDNVDEILKLIHKASDLDPEEPIYYRMIAKFLIHRGSYDEAISAVEKTLPIKQSLNERAHNNLIMGILYDLKGERGKAISYYRNIDELMQKKPDDAFGVNKVLWAFAKKYEKIPFSKEQLGDRSVAISFAQDNGIE